jgi:hypothetical protein
VLTVASLAARPSIGRRPHRRESRALGAVAACVSASVLSSAMVGTSVEASVIGMTSTVRRVPGGHLINIFAVTDSSSDRLFYVSAYSGCNPQFDCGISTNSAGGFLQGIGGQSVFAPSGDQSWTTIDSFLTLGGTLVAATGEWRARFTESEGSGLFWNVTYVDTVTGTPVTVDSFMTASNTTGFLNPNTSAVPPRAGWWYPYSISGMPLARSLVSIGGARQPYVGTGGLSYGSSSAAAADGQWGFLVAQFHVSEWGGFGPDARHIDWRMAVAVFNGTTFFPGVRFSIRVGEVCVGDINHDAAVDGVDLGLLLAAWGTCATPCASDMNNSGAVDGVDLGILLAGWGPCTG